MIVISQPRYLPALSYIQRIYFAETFVLLDNVQRQKRGFENRNRVLVNGKPRWVTVPSKSSSRALIKDTKIEGKDWIAEHKHKLKEYYSEAPFFDESLIHAYFGNLEDNIVSYSFDFTDSISYLLSNIGKILDFEPAFQRASAFQSEEIEQATGPDKIFEICNYLNADLYISGLNGREYGILDSFEQSSIDVKFHADRSEPYSQGKHDFVPHMAFFDPLFNAGKDWTEHQVKKQPKLEN